MKVAAADLTKDSARVNHNFEDDILDVFNVDDELLKKIGKMRKEKDRETALYEEIQRQYAEKEAEFEPEIMRKIEREVYLKVLDTLWMQHLENMQHLREGIHWRSVGQRDPLVEYRSESQKLFDGLEKSLREEVLKILLSLTKLEAQSEKLTDGQEYESELTKMAEGATEKGVNEISAGEKNLDKEFKENTSTSNKSGNNPNLNQQRNMARKDKKKQRQNKKKGKQQ
jgi:preprotein translocase subunit SecA